MAVVAPITVPTQLSLSTILWYISNLNLWIADAGNVNTKRKFMGSQGSNPITKPTG